MQLETEFFGSILEMQKWFYDNHLERIHDNTLHFESYLCIDLVVVAGSMSCN